MYLTTLWSNKNTSENKVISYNTIKLRDKVRTSNGLTTIRTQRLRNKLRRNISNNEQIIRDTMIGNTLKIG